MLNYIHKCDNPKCNNIVSWITIKGKFSKYCSKKCRGCHNSSKSRKKSKETCLEKYGEDNPMLIKEFKDKIIETNTKRYGVPYTTMDTNTRKKMENTNIERYGVKTTLLVPAVMDKIAKTNIKNLGVANPFSSFEIQKQIVETNIEKYGVEYPQQSKTIRLKTELANLAKYGIKWAMITPAANAKRIATNMEKFGVANPSQNAEIAEKILKNTFKKKLYIFPSGRGELVQGYEPIMLDKLLFEENIPENEIFVKRTDMPEIWWEDDNMKKHRYYPDIFIKSQNRIIEVKSNWTARKELRDEIKRKLIATANLGYNVELIILS